MGASFLTLQKAFNLLLLPAWWGVQSLPASCPSASPGLLCCLAHPPSIPQRLVGVPTRTSWLLQECSRDLTSFLTCLVTSFHTSDSLSLAFFTVCLFCSLRVSSHVFPVNHLNLLYLQKHCSFLSFMLSYSTPMCLLNGFFCFLIFILFFQSLNISLSIIIVLPLPSGVLVFCC